LKIGQHVGQELSVICFLTREVMIFIYLLLKYYSDNIIYNISEDLDACTVDDGQREEALL